MILERSQILANTALNTRILGNFDDICFDRMYDILFITTCIVKLMLNELHVNTRCASFKLSKKKNIYYLLFVHCTPQNLCSISLKKKHF